MVRLNWERIKIESCERGVRIRSYSGPYSPAFRLGQLRIWTLFTQCDSIFYYLVSRSAQQIRTQKKKGKHFKNSGKWKTFFELSRKDHRKRKLKNTWHLLFYSRCKCIINIHCVFQYIFLENLILLNSVFWLVNAWWQNLRWFKIVTQKFLFL